MIYRRGADWRLFTTHLVGVLYADQGRARSVQLIPYCLIIGIGRIVFRLGVMK